MSTKTVSEAKATSIATAAVAAAHRVKEPCHTCTSASLSVAVATSTSITILSTEAGRSLGAALSLNNCDVQHKNRVLVKDGVAVGGSATSSKYNGLYVAKYAGGNTANTCVLSRANDMDAKAQVVGAVVLVMEGDETGSVFMVDGPASATQTFTLGTSALVWTRINAGDGGFITATQGLASTSRTVRLDVSSISATMADCSGSESFAVHDGTTQKKITYASLRNAMFADVAGDATVAGDGVLTIEDGAVDNNKLLYSTISGVALGGTLPSLTLGTGISAVVYNGSEAVEFATGSGSIAAVDIDVSGNAQVGGTLAVTGTSAFGTVTAGQLTVPNDAYLGCTDAPELVRIKTDGIHVSGTISSSSDERLKRGIVQCGGLDLVRRLRGTAYQWRSTGQQSLGVIAQELAVVLPELVQNDAASLGVNYNGLVAVLINGVNDLDQETHDLRTLVNNLGVPVQMMQRQLMAITGPE